MSLRPTPFLDDELHLRHQFDLEHDLDDDEDQGQDDELPVSF